VRSSNSGIGLAKPLPFNTNNFDLLRLFAALQVVINHSMSQLSLEYNALYGFSSIFFGVPIFFMISGYLISASWESKPSLPLFARNRLLRIMPGLWMCLVVSVLVAGFFGYSALHPQGLRWFKGPTTEPYGPYRSNCNFTFSFR